MVAHRTRKKIGENEGRSTGNKVQKLLPLLKPTTEIRTRTTDITWTRLETLDISALADLPPPTLYTMADDTAPSPTRRSSPSKMKITDYFPPSSPPVRTGTTTIGRTSTTRPVGRRNGLRMATRSKERRCLKRFGKSRTEGRRPKLSGRSLTRPILTRPVRRRAICAGPRRCTLRWAQKDSANYHQDVSSLTKRAKSCLNVPTRENFH